MATVTDDFRHRTTLRARFRDIDAFGHVNNAVFSSYVEQARITYLLEVLRSDQPFARLPLILARIAIDFRSPIMFGEEVTVHSRVGRIGRTSFGMEHRMTAGPDERLAAEVSSVLVCFDYATGRPIPVPEEWRDRLSEYECRPLDAGARLATTGAVPA
ncbi:MAG: acyl-CoA thioesterase [Chloroflexi bacterium]|nr:acyl-CoA thioesterase [Chloroflexota bacterium]